MKKKKERALEYMLDLGIAPAKSVSGFMAQISKTCGKEYADEIAELIAARDKPDHDDLSVFYCVKNRSMQTSIAVSGGFDGDIIRKTCNWIDTHRHLFGRRILDVGCDNGIVSCFIAMTLPDACVTAIDRCSEAIDVAKQLAKRMHLSNITFCDSAQFDFNAEQYDTVFSSRTMQENLNREYTKEDRTRLFDAQVDQYRNAAEDYAQFLCGLVAEGGNLISIERVHKDPLYLAWLLSLNENGLVPDRNNFGELVCRELGREESSFPVTVANCGNGIDEDQISSMFCDLFGDFVKSYKAQYFDWEASLLLHAWKGELIEGYYIYDKAGNKLYKEALWTNIDDEDSILVEQHNVQQHIHCLSNCVMSSLDNCKTTIQNGAKENLSLGNKVASIAYNDGVEIETFVSRIN